MIDFPRTDLGSAAWVDHHATLGNAIARWSSTAVAPLGTVFERLHVHQFDASWRHRSGPDQIDDTNAHEPQDRLIGWNWYSCQLLD